MFDKNFNFGANVQFVGQISSGEVGYYSARTYSRGECEFLVVDMSKLRLPSMMPSY